MKKMAILPKYFNTDIMHIQRDFYLQQFVCSNTSYRGTARRIP